METNFNQTYLYKLHTMTNLMDRLFDQCLRRYADISLSQFTLLLSVADHGVVGGRTIAEFLELTPSAISRQVDLAYDNGWLNVVTNPKDRRGHKLSITQSGASKVADGLVALEQNVLGIFDKSDCSMSLMHHIDGLIGEMKE